MDQKQDQATPEFDKHTRNAGPSNDPSHHAPESGISNRPIDEEKDNQERLPPRGEAKEE